MTCAGSSPSVYLVGSNGSSFSFPSKIAWESDTVTFDFSSWLSPTIAPTSLTAESGFAITTEFGQDIYTSIGPDLLLTAIATAAPNDIRIVNTTVGANSVSVQLADGVPYTDHVITCTVTTQQGNRGAFNGRLYVVGGDAATSPYIGVESGYPITTENGNLIYWGTP